MTRPPLVTLTAALLLGGAVAHADPQSERREAARRFSDAGRRLVDHGQFKDAAVEFAHAFRETPDPALLLHVADAYDRAGLRREALTAYRQYLALAAEKPDAADAQAARVRADVLDKELAPAPARNAAYPYLESATRHAFRTVIAHEG